MIIDQHVSGIRKLPTTEDLLRVSIVCVRHWLLRPRFAFITGDGEPVHAQCWHQGVDTELPSFKFWRVDGILIGAALDHREPLAHQSYSWFDTEYRFEEFLKRG